jgi:ATP-dependent DNA ligase
MAVFAKLRRRRNDRQVVLYAFDLLELDGQDLRREPLVRRKVLLARLLVRARVGLEVNDHLAAPGDVVFRHACRLGLEGIACRSSWARATLRGARATGSSSRIRRRRRCVARLKKIGDRWREAAVDVGGARPGSGTLKTGCGRNVRVTLHDLQPSALTTEGVSYDSPPPCVAGIGDINSSVLRPK